MKRIFISLFALTAALGLYAQPTLTGIQPATTLQLEAAPATTGAAQIAFEKTTFEFGEIPQGKPATCRFEFTNTGSADLMVTNAKAGCGCTTPNWTKTAIKPGEKGFVDATYNAAGTGMFTKNVTVESNAGTPIVLYLKGEVKTVPAPEPTPLAAPSLAPAVPN